MLQLARLSQWPQRPSAILNLPELGYSDDQCLDFDFGIVDFWNWFELRQDEQIPVPEGSVPTLPNKGNGWTWGKKYQTIDAILQEFGKPPFRIDPEVAAIDIGDMLAGWDPAVDYSEMGP